MIILYLENRFIEFDIKWLYNEIICYNYYFKLKRFIKFKFKKNKIYFIYKYLFKSLNYIIYLRIFSDD